MAASESALPSRDLQPCLPPQWATIILLPCRAISTLPSASLQLRLLRLYMPCVSPIFHLLFFVYAPLLNLELLYNNLVLRFSSFRSNFLVQFCARILSYYVIFCVLISISAALFRQLATVLVSLLLPPFLASFSLPPLPVLISLIFVAIIGSASLLISLNR